MRGPKNYFAGRYKEALLSRSGVKPTVSDESTKKNTAVHRYLNKMYEAGSRHR
jgi:hypothetical protein